MVRPVLTQGADLVQGSLDIILTFQMEVLQAGAGLGKGLRISQRVAHNKVDVIKRLRQPLMQAGQHRHAKADVGTKITIHHVIMQHLSAGVQHQAALGPQLCKVGRQVEELILSHCIVTLRYIICCISPISRVLPGRRG